MIVLSIFFLLFLFLFFCRTGEEEGGSEQLTICDYFGLILQQSLNKNAQIFVIYYFKSWIEYVEIE